MRLDDDPPPLVGPARAGHSRRRRVGAVLLAVVIGAGTWVVAFGPAPSRAAASAWTAPGGLHRFSDCRAFTDYMRQVTASDIGPYGDRRTK